MKTRDDHDNATSVVGAVIRGWDPYSLLANGAPDDEFDSEIASVAAQIPRIASRNYAMHAVSRVFSSAFNPDTFAPEHCSDVGHQLYAALVHAKLIDA